MRKKLLLLLLLLTSVQTQAQYLRQYFDGADTNLSNSIFVHIDTMIAGDTVTHNTWQIGKPQKTIFNSAATIPNAIVTDTINSYPRNDSSSFTLKMHFNYNWGIFALQWKQKIDFDKKKDGGIIEYSLDTGQTWKSVFHSPDVYNFYGFQAANSDTLVSGQYAFSGTDTIWRDIWLCFHYSFMSNTDTPMFRFRIMTDSVDTPHHEGWLIDNLVAHRTTVHGLVKDVEEKNEMKVYPSVTTGMVNIECEKLQEYHLVNSLQVIGLDGNVLKEYRSVPVKYFIDIADLPNSMYYIRVETNLKTEVHPVILAR